MDGTCGVGPFTIPLAKHKHHILANDLNEESYKYLKDNIKLNNVE